MTYELIVSEKPSAAKRIAESLADGKPVKKDISKVPYYELSRSGKDIVVASAVGHLFAVAEKEKSFKYPSFDLEWRPNSEVDKNSAFSKKYLNVLKKLGKNADSFTIATDYDIEGEVIGLNVVRHIFKKDDARRMKFSTLTKDDLIEAYDKAQKNLNWGQANAGETRHFLDWMYGINLSRALMTSIKEAGMFKIMSIGRVQGPALKILVEKEKTISEFKPEPYWQLNISSNKDSMDFEALHVEDKFWKKKKVDEVFENIKDSKEAIVSSVDRKEYKQPSPNPFDLGSLQTEAYKLFKITPKRTLEAAQNLYSSGFISYPRTSSQKLPAKLGYKKILQKLEKNSDYEELAKKVLSMPSIKPNEGEKSDPAHPAIYPTGLAPHSLEGYDEKIYDLVVKRFLATFGEWATRESLKITFDVKKELFVLEGKRTIDKGWHELYAPYVKQKEEDLPRFESKEKVGLSSVDLLEKETEPPRRYTPASIMKELEKKSLGTKATRADIVESLYKRGYVVDESLKATDLGIKTAETLEKYCPEILDEKLTRHFEEEMDKIRQEKMKKDDVLEESKKVLVDILKHFDENKKNIGNELKDAHIQTMEQESYLGKCHTCDGNIVIKRSKKSRKLFAACDKYPDCEVTYPLPQGALVKTADKECGECNHPMIKAIRKGKRPQEVCINPDCPTKRVDESKIEEKDCPKCKSKLVVRKSVYGSFYGCSGYPKCRYTEKIEKE